MESYNHRQLQHLSKEAGLSAIGKRDVLLKRLLELQRNKTPQEEAKPQIKLKKKKREEVKEEPKRRLRERNEEGLTKGMDVANRMSDIVAPEFNKYPSKFKTKLLEEPMNTKEGKIISHGTCFDFIELTDEKIKQYLAKDRKNNVVLMDIETNSMICSERAHWKAATLDLNYIFAPCGCLSKDCKKRHLYAHDMFVKMALTNRKPAFVPFKDLEVALRAKSQIFKLEKSTLTLSNTFSAELLLGNDPNRLESSDHCQKGTSKEIERLIALN
jgi:hypothetical protein